MSPDTDHFLYTSLTDREKQFFVALDHFGTELAGLFIQQACALALGMGLHHESGLFQDQQSDEACERRNLYWTLFILDKNWSLVKGKPCYLPSSETSIALPEESESVLCRDYFLARIKLAQIQEDIYIKLYSARAILQQNTSDVDRIHNLLQKWSVDHGRLLSVTGDSLESSVATDLLWHHRNSSALVLSRANKMSLRLYCLEESRKSLQDLRIAMKTSGVETIYALRRYVPSSSAYTIAAS